MAKNTKFKGTDTYIATEDLMVSVNAAISLEKPLIIKGEPGTGKTLLAFEIAKSLSKNLISWHIKSTTTAQQGLYEYDAVTRLRDSQLGMEGVADVSNYIKPGKLWESFNSRDQVVLLIDEIDKADIEFPNDLLLELDKMEFYCYELQKTIKAKKSPIVVITSNNEKELPDAFLRRCFFHYIAFPERDTMKEIVDVHYPDLEDKLLQSAMRVFYEIRDLNGIKKKPSTSELIDWIKLLVLGKITSEELDDIDVDNELPPYVGSLLKNEQDHGLIRLVKRRFR
ncbi:MAG: MoxR family ATPase [Candidatus Dadabacteria bacterium]|nr:MoxR family ATPase [Candidatus Dadabacteria bacterium]NIV42946.1 AAA family ATPase [Candidatus Dadabacteria bacterium]NIX16005.1 AAA family ATPase [Candidatus Dadabacteria bacterium]